MFINILKSTDKRPGLNPPLIVNMAITVIALGFLFMFVIMPLIIVLKEAFSAGLSLWWASITEKDALSALRLTLLVAAIAVPVNLVFGLAASWALAKFRFKGKSLIITPVSYTHLTLPTIYSV